jgi:two-component system sensor histidine kinase BaeS
VEFELQMPESLLLFADKSKIEKIIKNLLINIISISFKNSKVIIKIIKQNSEINFQIKTNSRYIEPFLVDEMFKKNKKYVSQYSKPSISLGLYVLSRIIYAHFGSVYAKSYSNNTNIIGFLLPLKKCN